MNQSENTPLNTYMDDHNTTLGKQIILNVLETTLDKLAILKFINGWKEDEQTTVEYKTIEELCNIVKNDDVFPRNSKNTVDLMDFRRDCSFIESTIQKTFDEISSKGTYTSLSALTSIFKRLEREERELHEDTKNKEETYIRLQDTYYSERATFRRDIDEMMVKIGNLKDEIKDFEQEAKTKSNYVTSWENSKSEINSYLMNGEEKKLNDKISEKQHDLMKENRVHQEILNIFNETEMDIQKQLKKWKIKYEHYFASISAKIDKLNFKIEKQQEKTGEMVKKYIKRQEEIDCYNDFKIEQGKKRLEKENKNKAATTIQAWWRGTMVRKGFGKYKKKKDKKGKKRDDKKK